MNSTSGPGPSYFWEADSFASDHCQFTMNEEKEKEKEEETQRSLSSAGACFSSQDLSKLYQMEFNSQNLQFVESDHCLRIIEMISTIEGLLKNFSSKFSDREIDCIRLQIRDILISKDSFENKMAELGAACYFIEREPLHESLVEKSFCSFYSDDLKVKLIRFEKDQSDFDDARFPSGKITCLLKSFARMIFISAERLNEGGIYTILQIVDDFFGEQEDHLMHIKAVLHMILMPSFIDHSILQKPLSHLHPDAELLIRAELKIPQGKPVSFRDAKVACLYALFYDLRQPLDSNCYAVASLIYVMREHPIKAVARLLELFETGSIHLEQEGISVPLLPLVSYHLTREPSLNLLRSKAAIASSAPFQTALAVLNLDVISVRDEPTTVHAFIDHILRKKKRVQDFTLAKAIYCSFTQSVLQQTLLAAVQFLEINCPSPMMTNSLKERPIKDRLVLFIKEQIIEDIKGTIPDFQDKERILKSLESKMQSYFWIQDYSIHSSFTENGNLMIERGDKSIEINGKHHNLIQLQSLLGTHRRFIKIKEGLLTPIETVSQFKEECSLIIEEIESEARMKGQPLPSSLLFLMRAYFASSLVRDSLALFMHQINQTEFDRLQPDHYYHADVLLFYCDGGFSSGMPITYFNLGYQPKRFALDSDESNVVAISEWLNDLAKRSSCLKKSDLIFPCCSKTHAFILTPFRFKSLWTMANVKRVIGKSMVKPAMNLLAAPLPPEKMSGILLELGWSIPAVRDLLSLHQNDFDNGESFKNYFLNKLDDKSLPVFKAAFERHLLGMSDEEFKRSKCFFKIMKEFYGLGASDPRIDEIYREFFDQLESIDQVVLTSLEIAFCLKKTLIARGFHGQETHEIESFINKNLDRPCRYIIGNLNYRDEEKEIADHCLLTLEFNLFKLAIEFAQRINHKDKDLTPSHKLALKEFTIFCSFTV